MERASGAGGEKVSPGGRWVLMWGPGLLDFLARAVTLGKSFATLGTSP